MGQKTARWELFFAGPLSGHRFIGVAKVGGPYRDIAACALEGHTSCLRLVTISPAGLSYLLNGSLPIMKRMWSNLDLHGKFRLLAFAGLVIWLFNFFIVYFEINQINQATKGLERFEDLYNSILEIRRYEK
ncbi:MAG: hypothetical protein ACK2U0_19895, partial [Candidatus Promineifilaceae bacterium]